MEEFTKPKKAQGVYGEIMLERSKGKKVRESYESDPIKNLFYCYKNGSLPFVSHYRDRCQWIFNCYLCSCGSRST
jgi:hypothetical protein